MGIFGMGERALEDKIRAAHKEHGQPARSELQEAMTRAATPAKVVLPSQAMREQIVLQRGITLQDLSNVSAEIARLTALQDSLTLVLRASDAALAEIDKEGVTEEAEEIEKALDDGISLDPIKPEMAAKSSSRKR